MVRKLSPKAESFVAEYLLDLNAAAAYRRAGYKPRTDKAARNAASRLLATPAVAHAVEAAKAARARRTLLAGDEVLRELTAVAFSDIGQIINFTGPSLALRPPSTIPESARQAIASMKVRRYVEGHGDDAQTVEVTEFKLWDKNRALELLGKHLGLFVNKVALTDPTGEKEFSGGLSDEERLRQIKELWRRVEGRREAEENAKLVNQGRK